MKRQSKKRKSRLGAASRRPCQISKHPTREKHSRHGAARRGHPSTGAFRGSDESRSPELASWLRRWLRLARHRVPRRFAARWTPHVLTRPACGFPADAAPFPDGTAEPARTSHHPRTRVGLHRLSPSPWQDRDKGLLDKTHRHESCLVICTSKNGRGAVK